MEIFNVGPMELIFIVLLAFVLVGPQEMIRLTRRAGELIRKASQSPFWKEMTHFKREIRDLPVRLAREAGFDELEEELRKGTRISLDRNEKPAPAENRPGDVRSPVRNGPRPQPPGAAWFTVSAEEPAQPPEPRIDENNEGQDDGISLSVPPDNPTTQIADLNEPQSTDGS